ncbi:MAG: cold shock domain-containing protein [Owenweeksia sp.]
MGRSQETFGKKEREKKRQKRKEAKAKRKEERQSNSEPKGDNITYVDKFGNFSSTPPPPVDKVDAEEIVLGVPKKEDRDDDDDTDIVRKGVVTFYNDAKGFGFIKDKGTQQSVFVHKNNLTEPIVEQNMVNFEIGKGPKGPIALKVKVIR